MKLERLSVGVFKSLFEVDVSPGPLNTLAGSNGAGKTNFVDSLVFLAEMYRNGLEMAVARQGGFEAIAFRAARRTSRPVTFDVTMSFGPSEFGRRRYGLELVEGVARFEVNHRFEIGADSTARTADFRVRSESVNVTGIPTSGRRFRVVSIERDRDRIRIRSGTSRRFAESTGLAELREPTDDRAFARFVNRYTGRSDAVIENLSFNPCPRILHRAAQRYPGLQTLPVSVQGGGSSDAERRVGSERNEPAGSRTASTEEPAAHSPMVPDHEVHAAGSPGA